MIHEIGVAIQKAIRDRGLSIVIVDGPEPQQTTTFGRERIVFEYGGGDTFVAPKSQHVNPKHAGDVVFGAKATIYAQSPRGGAMPFEHRRRAHQIVRQLVVALREELLRRGNPLTLGKGDFVTPADLSASEIAGGAVYVLPFGFQAGIPAETWAGEKEPETALTKIRSTTRVTNDPDATAGSGETSCGS